MTRYQNAAEAYAEAVRRSNEEVAPFLARGLAPVRRSHDALLRTNHVPCEDGPALALPWRELARPPMLPDDWIDPEHYRFPRCYTWPLAAALLEYFEIKLGGVQGQSKHIGRVVGKPLRQLAAMTDEERGTAEGMWRLGMRVDRALARVRRK